MTEEKPANQTGDADAGGSKPLGITQEKLNELLGGVRTETRTAYEKDLAKVKAEYDEKIKIAP